MNKNKKKDKNKIDNSSIIEQITIEEELKTARNNIDDIIKILKLFPDNFMEKKTNEYSS